MDQPGLIALVFTVGFFVTVALAVIRYKTVDEFLRFWGGIGSLSSAFIGAIAT